MQAYSIEVISGLISRIYDCSLQPGLWPETLVAINRTLNGAYAAVTLADMTAVPPRAIFMTHSGWDDQQLQRMNDEYALEIPGMWTVLNGEIDRPFATMSEIPLDEWRTCRFYREWVEPQGLQDGCVTKFSETAQRLGMFSFATSADREIISADEVALVRLLSPHIRRAALIGDLLNQAQVAVASYRATFDGLACPVFLTDRSGLIKYQNAAAEALMESRGRDAASQRSVLNIAPAAMRAHLADAILSAATQTPTELGARGTGLPLSANGAAPMVGYVLPLRNSDVRGSMGGAEIAVFVSMGKQHLPLPRQVLRELFGMTNAETQVAVMIGEGRPIPEIAEQLQVKDNTIKTHLARIFMKTGTSRQPELATMMAQLAMP